MSRVSREYYEIKKASIIDAALEVCKRKTVSSVTMQDIIDEAGISQGGIYRYYKNIDEVLTDLLSRIRMEQYESIDILNAVFDQKKAEIQALRELPAGARQCGVPDVYPLASSRAEKGPIGCRRRVK